MDNPAIARLDAAITRVENAIAARHAADALLERRHATLKATMAQAVVALDAIIANAAESEAQR
ncbi:hypothetical protein GCM10022253_30410 [Sphingomonas endophytica]|jgi:hypothetical protein|uniref:Uncharacterized protein n=1 Tax=Sphingomonas endophytica TaxID=869719 RepID=A0ABR6N7T4_9SPHN|nr:hypothetical protein [Sphingomonas endophytica]MBB5726594.1 hypothetical protein [Sphingomonas endophytica]